MDPVRGGTTTALVLRCLMRVPMAKLEENTAPIKMKYEDIPRTADQRATLVAFLEWQRSTLARKCAGLTAEQVLRRSAAPSVPRAGKEDVQLPSGILHSKQGRGCQC